MSLHSQQTSPSSSSPSQQDSSSQNEFSPSASSSQSSKQSPLIESNIPHEPSKNECTYIKKELNIPIIPLEPEFLIFKPNVSPREFAQQIFPKGWHFIPECLEKSRIFYEFILVDTDSITLTHEYDFQDDQNILYSKLIINKVLTVRQWNNKSIYTQQAFSEKFDPQGYNYVDYQKAWFNFMFIRPYSHSWFISFKRGITKFPNWFLEWFYHYGPITSLLPSFAQEAFELFKSKVNFKEGTELLHFFANFGVTWILTWDYTLAQKLPSSYPTYLARDFSIRWWSENDPSLLTHDKIITWLQDLKMQQNYEFLSKKFKGMADLVPIFSKQELLEKLEVILKECNEDVCYDIDLNNVREFD